MAYVKKQKEATEEPTKRDILHPQLKGNYVVKSPITRLSKAGKKLKYTPNKLIKMINGYFGWCEEQDRVPSITGLMIHIKMSRDSFYKYAERSEFIDIIEDTRIRIAEWCANDVYRTSGQAAGKIAYMKNIHNWAEKTEGTTTVTKVLSVEDATARIASLAPALLEMLKGETLKQITTRPKLKIIEAQEVINGN